MSLDELYREIILDHYKKPRNKGPLEEADIEVHRYNPLCGDDLTVRVKLDENGKVAKAAFEGQGCSISQASASMLTEAVLGRSLKEVDQLILNFRRLMAGEQDIPEEQLGELAALKGVVKYPVRIKCAVLAWDALQAGVEEKI